MKTRGGEDLLDLLRRGEPVSDVHISNPLDLGLLCDGYNLHGPIQLFGCRIRRLDAACLQFHRPVALVNCTVESAEGAFYAAYFLDGMHVAGCSFYSAVDFQCGGHNKYPAAIVIENTTFAGFVNFFDCWFMGPVVVRNCRFEGGTNLLGNKGQPFEVQFDLSPIIEGNVGNLDLNRG